MQKCYDHPAEQIARITQDFRLNEQGVDYLMRSEPWVLREIETHCRKPDEHVRDPTGWMMSFGIKRQKDA